MLFRSAKIALGEHDQISLAMETKIENGMTINIERAYPVTIQVDGETVEVMTAFENVSEILNEYQIEVDKSDVVEPAINSLVGKNATILVKRMKQEVVVEKVVIPYERVVKHNDSMDKGKLKVLQKGRDGEKEVEYRIVYEDGKEISREMVEERIIAETQNEVVEQGTAQFIATSDRKSVV